MGIVIPGYETVFENAVYGVDGTRPIKDADIVLVREILLLNGYTQPNEDEVVDYLQRKAREVEGVASLVLLGGNGVKDRSSLEKAIIALPEQIRRDIRTGDAACMGFIRRNTAAPVKKDAPADRFVSIEYGLLPTDLVTENQIRGNINSPDWYAGAFDNQIRGNINSPDWYAGAFVHDDLRERGFGNRFNVHLLLSNRALPDRTEVDILVKHGTYSSRTLDVNRSYERDEMMEIVNAVYAGLTDAGKIELLGDISSDILEKLTLIPVMALHEEVKERLLSTVRTRR